MLVLDASALLAFLLRETGRDVVADAIVEGAQACTINLAEVTTVLVRNGMPAEKAEQVVSDIPIAQVDLDLTLAVRAGAMTQHTRGFRISLADRACLALAARERQPALTADREWVNIAPLIGVEARLIR